MAHGGKRPGAGRKKGVPNKDRAAFIALLKADNRVERLVEKLLELAEGVQIKRSSKKKAAVYKRPPNAHAAMWLLEQAFGKARQCMVIEPNLDEKEEMGMAMEKLGKMSSDELVRYMHEIEKRRR